MPTDDDIAAASTPDSTLPIIMIGAGGHARVLLDLLECLGREVLFITDRDSHSHGQRVRGAEVRGADELIYSYAPDQVLLVNAVGSTSQPLARREVYERFRHSGYVFATLVHPSATVSKGARLEKGVQIMAGVILQPGARIGENSLINTGASVDHDCVIGPHSHIGPGVTLSGNVQVGDTTHLGTGATAIQGIRIGRDVMVGAGAVIIRNVPDGQRVVGVPARPITMKVPTAAAAAAGHPEELFTVMLSAAGRRVALLRLLDESVRQVGLEPRMLATDITPVSAAFHATEVARLVPRYSDPACLGRLLDLCREMSVGLIVPTIDPDLPFYATHRKRFEQIGTRVMVSSAETIDICNDKRRTHEWLTASGFPVVPQIDAQRLLSGDGDDDGWTYPVFVKPRGGSSSVGARVVRDPQELRLAVSDDSYIAQRVARGNEYTVDVYVDRTGRCRSAVPRLRIETRGGEVNKGMTIRCREVEQTARCVAETLPGAWGVLNIQIFFHPASGELTVSEINPRFGGGYPLTHQAGAPMARWIVEEVTGRPLSGEGNEWTEGLVMLRYDDAIFVRAETAGLSPTGMVDARDAAVMAASAARGG